SCIELSFALRDYRSRRRMLCLPLGDKAASGFDSDLCTSKLRLGLPALGFELIGIHPGQKLTRLDEVAFVDQDLLDPPGGLCCHVDFDRLDAAIAAGDAGR